MAQLGAKVRVYGDWDGSALKGAEKDLGAFGGKLNSLVAPALLGAAAAAGALAIKLGVDGVKAAAEDQASMVSLAQTLNNLNLAHDTGRIEDYIYQLERSLGIADTELRPAYDRLVRSIGDTEEANRALKLSLDISAGSGKSLEQVVEALGKAYSGSTVGLSRLGAGLDMATLRTGDMNLITKELSRTFEGQATKSAQTFEGQAARVTTALDNLKEAFGYGLITAIGDTDSATQDFVETLEDLEPIIKRQGERLGLMAQGALILAKNMGALEAPTNEVSVEAEVLTNNFGSLFGIIRNAISPMSALESSLQLTAIQAKAASYAADTARDSFVNMLAAAAASKEVGRAQSAQGAATDRLTAQAKALGAEISWGNLGLQKYKAYLDEANAATQKTGGSQGSASSAIKQTTESFADQRKELLAALTDAPADKYAAAIEKLKENLADAEATFTNFKNSVVSSITQAFSFGDAYTAAKEAGTSFLDALKAQAEDAVGFADRIKQLVILGLSPEALQQVLAAGVTAGTGIANELITGGATAIDETNRLVESATNAAAEVGELAASAYYGTGLKNAQDTVQGFVDDLGPDGPGNKKMQRIMDNLARSLNRESTITVTTVYRTEGSPPSTSVEPRANGGPVNRNTPYLVGEQGPELFVPSVSGTIVPNGGSGGGVSMGGASINLTVNAGMGTNGAEVGRQIVDALKQYERRNGAVYVAA